MKLILSSDYLDFAKMPVKLTSRVTSFSLILWVIWLTRPPVAIPAAETATMIASFIQTESAIMVMIDAVSFAFPKL